MTPAINLLKKLKIPHKLYPYECEAHDDFGKHAATQLGLPEAQVFKTLIAHHDKQAVVAIVPSSGMCSLKQLAKEMDVRPSFITTDDTDLLPGVETGKYDVAINHIAMTAELKDQFDFSEAYSEKPELAIPFQKGNPAFQATLAGALERIKKDGRLMALSEKWFGMDASKPPKAEAGQ